MKMFVYVPAVLVLLCRSQVVMASDCDSMIEPEKLSELKAAAESSKKSPAGKEFKDSVIRNLGQNLADTLKNCTDSHPKEKYPLRIDVILEADRLGKITRWVHSDASVVCSCVMSSFPLIKPKAPPTSPFFVHLGITMDPKK
jgi:hypothetical protein